MGKPLAIAGGAVAGVLALLIVVGAIVGWTPDDTKDAAGTVSNTTPAVAPIAAPTTAEITPQPVAPPVAQLAPVIPAPPTPVAPTTQRAPAATSWPMPNEVGSTLQDAQDDIQRVSGNPLFFTYSKDEREDRMQILDSNWKVCNQNVAPGETFTASSHIVFGVVKLSERCP